MIDDVFCKIISQAPASENVVWEEKNWLAVNDIHPAAPVHILIIPKKHITSLVEAQTEDREILGEMIFGANELAQKLGLQKSGFRLIINTGPDGGQLVPHLHIHLLGGKKLGPKVVN